MRCSAFVVLSCRAERFFTFPNPAVVVPVRAPLRGELQRPSLLQGEVAAPRRASAPLLFSKHSAPSGSGVGNSAKFKKTLVEVLIAFLLVAVLRSPFASGCLLPALRSRNLLRKASLFGAISVVLFFATKRWYMAIVGFAYSLASRVLNRTKRGNGILADLDTSSGEVNRLKHVAIIMDGNGRWAKSRGQRTIAGHQQGAEALQKIIEESIRQDIKYLTVYAFSSENWQRPKEEVDGLMDLMRQMLQMDEEKFEKYDVRVRVIGDRSQIPQDLQSSIDRAEEKSAGRTGLTLLLAVSYGARQEIVNAARMVSKQVLEKEVEPDDICELHFENVLTTRGIPDPDLLIRTSGEQRISNFLLWQCAYTELYFTPEYWPDFDEAAYKRAIEAYRARKRTYGQRV